MKNFFILFCLLSIWDLICPVDLSAANPRAVAVRIVGSGPDPGVGGIAWEVWLTKDPNNMLSQAAVVKFEPYPTPSGNYDWEYLLVINLAYFQMNWVVTDYLNIEVTVNGKTSEPWENLISTAGVSGGFHTDPTKFITFPRTSSAFDDYWF